MVTYGQCCIFTSAIGCYLGSSSHTGRPPFSFNQAGADIHLLPQEGDPAPKSHAPAASTSTTPQDSTGLGVGLYALVLLGGALAFGAYKYLQMQNTDKK